MAVLFPDDQLEIFDYNRLVRDLNGLSSEEFLNQLKTSFSLELVDFSECRPSKIRDFSMYLDQNYWYRLTPLGKSRSDDPVKDLDVTILSELILSPILNLTDLRKSDRIDFVGGIRGLEELQRRVDSGEMKVAFALYPVSMDQLLSIADAGEIMPQRPLGLSPS